MFLNGICFITEKKYRNVPVYESVLRVLNSGVTFIQYREKDVSRRKLYERAFIIRKITRNFNATLIINDHADIALAVEADGVHLGQDDLPLKEARKVMKDRIIGISTHNLEQAKEAEKDGADYIGFGPVFNTTTKDAGKPVGVDNLRVIKQNVGIPVVAIGGISLTNLPEVINAGADAVAVATAIMKGDISLNTRELVGLIKSYKF